MVERRLEVGVRALGVKRGCASGPESEPRRAERGGAASRAPTGRRTSQESQLEASGAGIQRCVRRSYGSPERVEQRAAQHLVSSSMPKIQSPGAERDEATRGAALVDAANG